MIIHNKINKPAGKLDKSCKLAGLRVPRMRGRFRQCGCGCTPERNRSHTHTGGEILALALRSLSQGCRDAGASLGTDASQGPSEWIADRPDAVDTARIFGLGLLFVTIQFLRLVFDVHLCECCDQSNAETNRQQLHLFRGKGTDEKDTMAAAMWSSWVNGFGFW